MEVNECPFCGARIVSEKVLHNHVLHMHDRSTVINGSFALLADYLHHPVGAAGPIPHVMCWCGDIVMRIHIDDHWREAGGLASHILTIALGGNDAE